MLAGPKSAKKYIVQGGWTFSWNKYFCTSCNTLLDAVRHFRSHVMDAGSRGTTAHAHKYCIFQGYPKAVPSRMKLTMREPANHDNGKGVTASDVILQQRINTLKTPGSAWPGKGSIGAKLHSGSTMTRKSVILTRNMTQLWVTLTPLFVKSAKSWPYSG